MCRQDLISALNKMYPGWARKLVYMSDEQLAAIWRDKQAIIRKNKAMSFRTATYYIYYCDACCTRYETDNPEETSCRECGQERLERIGKRRVICQVSKSSMNS